MRTSALIATLLILAPAALADCPPDCVTDGGPAATNCFIEWSGISSMTDVCTDGDASCDVDGKIDGVCTLGIQGCINVPGQAACTPTGLSGPPTVAPSNTSTAQALASALAKLDLATHACTPPGLPLPLRGQGLFGGPLTENQRVRAGLVDASGIGSRAMERE